MKAGEGGTQGIAVRLWTDARMVARQSHHVPHAHMAINEGRGRGAVGRKKRLGFWKMPQWFMSGGLGLLLRSHPSCGNTPCQAQTLL